MQIDRLNKLLAFLENEPNDPFLKYALATEYWRLKQTDKALVYFEDLVKSHPNYTGTYYHLGKLYDLLDRKVEAIKIYEMGMKITKQQGDNHAFLELQSVYKIATGFEDDDN